MKGTRMFSFMWKILPILLKQKWRHDLIFLQENSASIKFQKEISKIAYFAEEIWIRTEKLFQIWLVKWKTTKELIYRIILGEAICIF